MPNKNFPRKSVRSHLFLEASMRESCLAKEEDKPLVSTAFEFNESKHQRASLLISSAEDL
jgi:hypothetical protein